MLHGTESISWLHLFTVSFMGKLKSIKQNYQGAASSPRAASSNQASLQTINLHQVHKWTGRMQRVPVQWKPARHAGLLPAQEHLGPSPAAVLSTPRAHLSAHSLALVAATSTQNSVGHQQVARKCQLNAPFKLLLRHLILRPNNVDEQN